MFEGATTLTGGENLLRSGRTGRAMRGDVKKNRDSDGRRELGGLSRGEREVSEKLVAWLGGGGRAWGVWRECKGEDEILPGEEGGRETTPAHGHSVGERRALGTQRLLAVI